MTMVQILNNKTTTGNPAHRSMMRKEGGERESSPRKWAWWIGGREKVLPLQRVYEAVEQEHSKYSDNCFLEKSSLHVQTCKSYGSLHKCYFLFMLCQTYSSAKKSDSPYSIRTETGFCVQAMELSCYNLAGTFWRLLFRPRRKAMSLFSAADVKEDTASQPHFCTP